MHSVQWNGGKLQDIHEMRGRKVGWEYHLGGRAQENALEFFYVSISCPPPPQKVERTIRRREGGKEMVTLISSHFSLSPTLPRAIGPKATKVNGEEEEEEALWRPFSNLWMKGRRRRWEGSRGAICTPPPVHLTAISLE